MALMLKAMNMVLTFCLVICCVVVLAAVPILVHFWLFLRLPAKPVFETRQFFIPPGTGTYGIAKILHAQGVVRDPRAFFMLAWLKKSMHRLQAGEYAFSTLATPEQVLDQIVGGRVVIHTATMPEGSTMWDVARIFEQKELVPSAEFLELVKDTRFIRSLGLNGNSLEGYLFPDTYHFKRPLDAAAAIKAMVQQFWNHMPREWSGRASQVGLTLHQLVTLASIIEKEAVVDSERPIIAGVFYNRLKMDMPLQSDPTTVYDIPSFTGPITAAHLTRQSPYNTYRIKGLPPGPICNPGSKSLMAALYPEKVSYLYFVSNNDGTHHFSTTVDEHRQAVGRYYEKKKKSDPKEPRAAAQAVTPANGVGVTDMSNTNSNADTGTPVH